MKIHSHHSQHNILCQPEQTQVIFENPSLPKLTSLGIYKETYEIQTPLSIGISGKIKKNKKNKIKNKIKKQDENKNKTKKQDEHRNKTKKQDENKNKTKKQPERLY